MKKIVHLSNPIGGDKGGGVSTVVKDYMLNQNHNKFILNLWFPGSNDYDFELKRYLAFKDRVKLLGLFGNSNANKIFIKKILAELKTVDIIHQHSLWLPPSFISLCFSKFYKGKTIVQPHGALAPDSLRRSSFKKSLARLFYEKYNLQNASMFIATSLKEVEDIKKILPSKPVALIPHGVSVSFQEHPSIKKHEFNELVGTKKAILFLSRIHPIKGLDRLIEAVSMLDKSEIENVLFIIAGSGEKKYINYLKESIRKNKLEKFFTFTGFANYEDKIALLDCCSCFILPSYTESFSVAIVEAMSRGLPVITTKGTPWQTIEENKCGFWVENSINGVKDGIRDFLTLTIQEEREYGKRAYQLIHSNFILEHNISKYEELYDYLLNQNITVPAFVY